MKWWMMIRPRVLGGRRDRFPQQYGFPAFLISVFDIIQLCGWENMVYIFILKVEFYKLYELSL